MDMEKNRRLMEAARPLRCVPVWSVRGSVTFHRAIDMAQDMMEAVEVLELNPFQE